MGTIPGFSPAKLLATNNIERDC